MRHPFTILLLVAVGLTSIPATAQETDDEQPPSSRSTEPTLPPVIVRPGEQQGFQPTADPLPFGAGYDTSGSISWLSGQIQTDSTRVGPYNQPAWTTQRPFTNSRVYVLPPGQAQFEQWVRPTWNRGEPTEFRFLEEIAIGLPGRFQLDIYERWNVEPNAQNINTANHEGVQVELRWALANWGVIPFNPTLYAEWVEKGGRQDKPNVYELKLLLGEELITNRLFYASNFILEQETSGERETELAWSHALSTPLIQRVLLAGMECRWTSVTVEGGRSNPTDEFQIGPSIQWRPTNRTFLDVAQLFGTTKESNDWQMYVIFGYQFGARAGPASGYISGPASTRGN